jgi:hypothetical protein
MNAPDHGTYLYAAVPAGTALDDSAVSTVSASVGAPAVDGVRVLDAGDVAFVVADADMDALARLGAPEPDPDTLAVLARRHDAVVRAAMDAAPGVLPFRLATVLRDDEAVRRLGAEFGEGLADRLVELTGTAEWGIRVSADEPVTVATPAEPEQTGTDFLNRRRRELAEQDRLRAVRDETAARVAGELRGMATDSSPGTASSTVLVDEALLVRGPDTARFLAAAERLGAELAGDGLRLRVSGPWPPYSFAGAVDAGD